MMLRALKYNVISNNRRSLYNIPLVNSVFDKSRNKSTTFHNYERTKNSNELEQEILSKTIFKNEILMSKTLDLAKKFENDFKIKPGQKIACFAENSAFSAVTMLAVWMAGGVFVPLSSKYPDEDIYYFLEDSGSDLFVHSEGYQDRVSGMNLGIQTLNFDVKEDVLNQNMPNLEELPTADHPALVIYTSGTTGRPKGALHTHPAVHSQVNMLLNAWQWSNNDSILHCLPLHHVHGLVNCLLCPLASGADIHMLPGFKNSKELWKCLDEFEVNIFMAVPTIYSRLVNDPEGPLKNLKNKHNFANKFRLLVSGSAALPKPVFDKFEQISGQKLLERYGMTEFCMGISNGLNEEDRLAGYVAELTTIRYRS